MKVKFINQNLQWFQSSSTPLILNEIYESDLCMDSATYFYINGNFYLKTWFEIIEEKDSAK